jgi:hypothetical protein
MKKLFFFFLSFGLFISFVNAQSVKFTSTYTNVLDSNCKSFDNENLEGDGDGYMVCPGIDEYELYVYYNFYGHEIIQVNSTDSNINYSGTTASNHCGDSHQYGAKIEWRYADGKPFAYIIRVICYYIVEQYDEELDMTFEAFEPGDEYLVIVGLAGYEKIQGEITVKDSKNANIEARLFAENAYLKIIFTD